VTATATAEAGRTGRPRSQAADEAILSATLDLVRRYGYGALTMTAVIERSGVSSATLYRRWATKHDLVVAALEHVRPEAVAASDTGSLEGDVRRFLAGVRASLEGGWVELAQAISVDAKQDVALGDALRRRFLEPRIDEVAAMLDRARRRGELAVRPPAEEALSLVIGPLHYAAVILGTPLTDGFLDGVAGAAVAGLQALRPTPTRMRSRGR